MNSPNRGITKPGLVIIGGPDVDKRIELIEVLRDEFSCSAIGSDPRVRAAFESRGIPFTTYPLSRRFDLLSDLNSVLRLRKTLGQLQPRVVHCFDTKPNVVGRLAARLAGVPAVVGTFPGLGTLYTYSHMPVRYRRTVFEALHRITSRLSQATVFQNSEDQHAFESAGVVPEYRSYRIAGSGVCARRFDPNLLSSERRKIREELGLSSDIKMVTVVARMIRSKGIMDLVQAAQSLESDRVRVVVVGPADPDAMDSLDPQEMELLRKHAMYLGNRPDVPSILASTDVFVCPTFYREGIPRVLVEASLMEVPVVATDVPGCKEVVEDGVTGVRVPPRNPQVLAQAVRGLLENPALARRLGENARRKALQHFELQVIADHHRHLYRKVLEGLN